MADREMNTVATGGWWEIIRQFCIREVCSVVGIHTFERKGEGED